MASPDVTAARAEAGAAMRRLRDAAGQVLSTIADAQPVAPQHLLVLRSVAEGATTPGEVATVCDRHASSISRVLDVLVDNDLVDRRPDPDDRRQVRLRLTDQGADLVRRFEQLDHALSARMLAGFDDEDARRLTSYLDRIAGNAAALASALEDDPDLLDEVRQA